MKELIFQKELKLINQMNQNNVLFDILKTLVVNLNHMFVINAMIKNIAILNIKTVLIIDVFYGI